MTPHRDTERVLARLTVGEAVGVNRGGRIRYGDVVDVGLGGVEVRYPDGAVETVRVHSASQPDRVSPADLEVVS